MSRKEGRDLSRFTKDRALQREMLKEELEEVLCVRGAV